MVANLLSKDIESASWKKGCPRNTFLGLCEAGRIVDVPPGNYTKSLKNKNYGLKILNLLENQPDLVNNKLLIWSKVVGEDNIKHNSQVDVVIALWNTKLIKDM